MINSSSKYKRDPELTGDFSQQMLRLVILESKTNSINLEEKSTKYKIEKKFAIYQ